MKNIKDYNIKELKEELVSLNEKPYRAEQIFKWIYRENVTSFEEMTDLSKELRQKLNNEYSLCNFNILEKQVSKDGTIKYLFDILDRKRNRNCTYGVQTWKNNLCIFSSAVAKWGANFVHQQG